MVVLKEMGCAELRILQGRAIDTLMNTPPWDEKFLGLVEALEGLYRLSCREAPAPL